MLNIFKLLKKICSSLAVHRKPGFHNFRVISMFKLIKINSISLSSDRVVKWFKRYVDRQTIYSLQGVLCFYQKKVLKSYDVLRRSWGGLLEEVLRTSLERHLKDVSLKMSWGRLLEDTLRTSFGRRLEDVSWKTSLWRLKKGCRNYHF